MTQSKNRQNDSIVESIAQQIKMVGGSKNILNLGGPLISNLLNKNNIPFSDIKPKLNLELGDYIDKLSNEKLWADELSNLENKFDLIILHDLLEQTKEPKLLLENLSNFLSDTGSMVATVKNFLYINNIFRIFEGVTPQSNPNNYDLCSLNLFLNNENFVISELDRNQEKIGHDLNSDHNEYLFPPVILELLKKDPEYEVVSYVFRILKKSVDPQAKTWSSMFSKNYFLEHLKNKIDYYETLETSIKDKEEVIAGLESSLAETKSYVENVIKVKSKDIAEAMKSVEEQAEMVTGLESSLAETKSYLEGAIKDKDEYIKEFRKTIFGKTFDFFRKKRVTK